jgi:hypothetical protein
VIGVALVAFPKLALGLSGFETGVLVMPQVTGGTGTEPERLARRIASTRRLLSVAAGIMTVLWPRPGRWPPVRSCSCSRRSRSA